jgi:hypothetical protein
MIYSIFAQGAQADRDSLLIICVRDVTPSPPAIAAAPSTPQRGPAVAQCRDAGAGSGTAQRFLMIFLR